MPRSFLAVLALHLGCSCAGPPPVVEREDGDRRPLAVECDPIDPIRCLLPWPSNAFAETDPASATGLRLKVDPSSMNPRDDATSLAAADGFSRVTPIATAFEAPLDPATLEAAVHLVLAQHDHAARGRSVPLRVDTVSNESGETLLVASPREVLEASADYVAIVTDELRFADGSAPVAPRSVRVALGLELPATEEEAELAGHHAPTRRLLERIGIAPERVLRVWEFTTRSPDDPRRALRHVREASVAAVQSATVTFDEVEIPTDRPHVALIVHGHLHGIPTFLTPEERNFVLDDEGLPIPQGTTDVPFRVLVPAGAGDYRFVMYGHGTGGHERDAAFDDRLAEIGVAKVNVRFYGWTENDVALTFARMREVFAGSAGAAASLVEALAHAAAIQRAMSGVLADALAADTIGGRPNPAAGRRPDTSIPIWVGGSLGGTCGLVYAALEPEVRYAVLNVPGAAWAQWIRLSSVFRYVRLLVPDRLYTDLDLALALAIAQTNLDMADGAAWSDVLAREPAALLIQESMGDPVMPNRATEMVAVAAGARHVGGVLEPILGVEPAD
ncbi:MAG TPA: hypothetical protein VIL20_24475, partial [Sandaracinaceae bacterium]